MGDRISADMKCKNPKRQKTEKNKSYKHQGKESPLLLHQVQVRNCAILRDIDRS